MFYDNGSYGGIATSTDLQEWTKLTDLPERNLQTDVTFFVNEDIYIENQKYSNGSWEKLPYQIYYSNGYYFWLAYIREQHITNMYRSTTPDLDTSEEHLYIENTDYSTVYNTQIVYYNPDKELLLFRNNIYLNKALVSSSYLNNYDYTDSSYVDDNVIVISNYVLYHNNYLYFRSPGVGQWGFGSVVISQGSTTRPTTIKFNLALGLVAYE